MIAGFDAIATGTDIQRRIGVKTSRDEPLARFTTMRVGGPADLFATVHNALELRALVRFARTRGLPHFVLGRGSDLVIADAGDPRPGHPGPGRGIAHRRRRATRPRPASRWHAPRPRPSAPA